jgi:hypothetical protein
MSTPRRPLDYLLLLVSTGILGSMLLLVFLPEGRVPMAAPHSTHGLPLLESTHQIGSQPWIYGLAIALSLFIILFMGLMIWMGNSRAGKTGPLRWWLLGAFAVYLFFFVRLYIDYHRYSVGGDETFFGGFPLPTGWMIYDIWLFPLLVALVLVYFFTRWNWTSADQQGFDHLLEQVRRMKKHGGEQR